MKLELKNIQYSKFASQETACYEAKLYEYLLKLIELGREIRKEQKEEVKVQKVVSLSPMQRLQNKISDTIMQDMLDLEDRWMDGENATIDLYKLFQTHGL